MLKTLENSVILAIKSIYDYWQIEVSTGTINIYNMMKINGEIDRVIGQHIIRVVQVPNKDLILILDNGLEIKVLLCDEAYSGPEAMSVYLNNGEVFVID